MQKVTLGILAHVDSGKTTLSEGLLYASGALRKLGRVDHGDAFLDTDALERERGITIFSKQAMLFAGDKEFTLLDTPGHVDFSAEMERTLSVLDYAVLVISGSDGVQSHTRTLWRLLTRYEVPTFLFINKMDLAGADKDALLRQLTATLSAECVDFSASQETRDEALALCDEAALEQLLERGKIDDTLIAEMVKNRKVFPCFFGSALKLDGVEDFLTALACFTREPVYPKEFGAKVFKISRDAQGARLTWLKVTGGALRVKAPLTYRAQNQDYNEKADQLRLYSGVKFRALEEAGAGSVVAVTGLSHSYVGLGLGAEAEASAPLLQPVLTYQLILPDGADAHSALIKLRELEEEDPMLRIVWDERYGQIHVQLMGKIQLEILRRRILDRFGLDVTFGEGSIVYRETIAAPVLGMGHFEPLRHYAEVQLLIEPLPRGAGIQLASNVPTDALDLNWQRLIFTHLLEREHAGVLTGSPLTDVKFTLVAGRAHLKHTEGGDFRQATYRAVRQGLMQAENVLLEPYYDFRLEVPAECVGRAMTDLQNMGGTVEPPQSEGETPYSRAMRRCARCATTLPTLRPTPAAADSSPAPCAGMRPAKIRTRSSRPLATTPSATRIIPRPPSSATTAAASRSRGMKFPRMFTATAASALVKRPSKKRPRRSPDAASAQAAHMPRIRNCRTFSSAHTARSSAARSNRAKSPRAPRSPITMTSRSTQRTRNICSSTATTSSSRGTSSIGSPRRMSPRRAAR